MADPRDPLHPFDVNVRTAPVEPVAAVPPPGPDEPHPPDQPAHPIVAAHLLRDPESLDDKIAAARTLSPEGKERHCLQCWLRGRDAALAVIVGK